ncbi:hypothetical protein ACFSKU_18375 [Pontibacter silvestris]|uniref:SpoIIAA-like n=1 Tax=Pontibacter silvestris TaxID=2305183 RepID=A0ABW4X2Y1_9BACT|nr:hypothetical protein [Pontibacter silvestris]MCC9138670.1 hypothetical protein [Pontibacter silvestris]
MAHILQSAYATVAADEENELVEVIWLRHCEEEEFREVLRETVRHVNAQGATKWLCDMKRLQYVLLGDQNWLVRELLPTLDPALRHRFAYVVTRSNLELMSSLRVHELVREDPALRRRLEVEVFLGREKATEWLA